MKIAPQSFYAAIAAGCATVLPLVGVQLVVDYFDSPAKGPDRATMAVIFLTPIIILGFAAYFVGVRILLSLLRLDSLRTALIVSALTVGVLISWMIFNDPSSSPNTFWGFVGPSCIVLTSLVAGTFVYEWARQRIHPNW